MEEDLSENDTFSDPFEWLYSDLSQFRDGDLADAEGMKRTLSYYGLELHSRAIVSGADVCWVVDARHHYYTCEGFLVHLNSELRWVHAIQASLDDWLESEETLRALAAALAAALVNTIWKSWLHGIWESSPENPAFSYAMTVSTVVLLPWVYQYLTGNVDRGGSKAYSRSSLDFRDIYVAIVLFLGAYVWIKFREVACKGVHPRKLVDKRGRITKVVYEPRFKPPRENGRVFQWIYLGQYATPEEASILYQIAAFYYNENHGSLLDLEDGRWFSIPPMTEAERSLTGAEKRAWVKDQAMKVYEDFKKEKAEAAKLLQELLEAWEVQVTQEQDEVNVDISMSSSLNSAEHQQPALVSQVYNSGMDIAMLDNHGLECASQSFGGMHESFAVSNGHSLGSQEGSAIPVSHLTPNTQSGTSINNSNELILLQTLVRTQQELITYQQQQISLQQQQLQDCSAQISELKYQHCLQQQLLDINEGVPSNDVEMEQDMLLQNHLSLVTLPSAAAEAQEAFI